MSCYINKKNPKFRSHRGKTTKSDRKQRSSFFQPKNEITNLSVSVHAGHIVFYDNSTILHWEIPLFENSLLVHQEVLWKPCMWRWHREGHQYKPHNWIVLSMRFKLVELEAISRVILTSEQKFRNFRPFVDYYQKYKVEIKSFVDPLIIQLVWQIQISRGESGGYLRPLRWINVTY